MDNQKKIKYYFWGMVLSICGVASFFGYLLFLALRPNQPSSLFGNLLAFSKAVQEEINLSNYLFPLFVVCIISFAIFQYCFKHYKILKTGLQGEKMTQNILKTLPNSYQIISNITIEFEGKRSEIDNLILSPRGIVIIETKNYKGILEGSVDDIDWKYTKTSAQGNNYTTTVKNPLKQVKRQTYILSQILKENNIEIVNRQELGIYTKITNLQFIKSVIYIFAIFILLLIANSAFIWKITIKGNYSYTAEQMIDYVHKKGVKEGVLKESIDTESLEKSIRKNFGDISWVCVEVKGTNLIIHIKENYITEISVKEDKPYDLVAECDCTIVSALVRRGKLNVNPKEKVKKGQVLITGVVDVTDESGQLLFNEYCNADGEIIGQIKEKYEEKLNIKYQDKKTEKSTKIIVPSFFEYKWIKNKGKNRELTCEETKMKFFGDYYLPISMQKYTIKKYKITEKNYSEEQAEKILNNKFNNKMFVMEQKGYKIIQKNVKIKKTIDSYALCGKITYNKPIGKVSYIDVKKNRGGNSQYK